MWGRWGSPSQDTPAQPSGKGAADCQGKGVWECIEVGAPKGMFDGGGMTSSGFHGMGHCTCRKMRELRWDGLEGGKPEGIPGSGQRLPSTGASKSKVYGTHLGELDNSICPPSLGLHHAGLNHPLEHERTSSGGRFCNGFAGLPL